MPNLIPLVDVPEGASGAWRIERFTVSAASAGIEMLRASTHGGRGVPEGAYTRLVCRGHTVMSDTPDERRDHAMFVRRAHGDILITGLGLGMVLQACLERRTALGGDPDAPFVECGPSGYAVAHATVVERSEDVLALAGPHYQARYGDRLTLVCADALTWQPPRGAAWDVAWHDIWPDLSTDNLAEMARIRRHYARRMRGWQGCWGEVLLRSHKRREDRQRALWG